MDRCGGSTFSRRLSSVRHKQCGRTGDGSSRKSERATILGKFRVQISEHNVSVNTHASRNLAISVKKSLGRLECRF